MEEKKDDKVAQYVKNGIGALATAVGAGTATGLVGKAVTSALIGGGASLVVGGAAQTYAHFRKDVGPLENLTVPKIEQLLAKENIKNNASAVKQLKDARYAIIRYAGAQKKAYDKAVRKGKETKGIQYSENWRNEITYGDTIKHPVLKNLGKDLGTVAKTINNHKVATALVGSGFVVAAAMASGGKSALQSSKDFIEKIGNATGLSDNFKSLVADFPGFVPMINGLVAVGLTVGLVAAGCKIAKKIEAHMDTKKDLTAAVANLDLSKDNVAVEDYINTEKSDKMTTAEHKFKEIVEIVASNNAVYNSLKTEMDQLQGEFNTGEIQTAGRNRLDKLIKILDAVKEKQEQIDKAIKQRTFKEQLGNHSKTALENTKLSAVETQNLITYINAAAAVAAGTGSDKFKILREVEVDGLTVANEAEYSASDIVKYADIDKTHSEGDRTITDIVSIFTDGKRASIIAEIKGKSPNATNAQILAALKAQAEQSLLKQEKTNKSAEASSEVLF